MSKLILVGIVVILAVGGFLLSRTPSTVEQPVQSAFPSVKASAIPFPTVSAKVSPSVSAMASPTPRVSVSPKTSPSPTPRVPATLNVSITNFAFAPAMITVKKGDKVIFTNKDSAPHTTTTQGAGWDSKTLSTNQSFTLDTSTLAAGTYQYHCNIHTSMKGSVVVQ